MADPERDAKSEASDGADYVSDVSFAELPLSEELRRAIAEKGYTAPTPVQAKAMPFILAGRDLIVRSKTGTGKTAAFGIPLLERLPVGTGKPQALVLCPTRELALQVTEELAGLGKHKKASVVTIYGGASMTQQIRQLEDGADIVVGTPGRVLDHLRRGTLDLGKAQAAVLDEADEMLSMGFFEEVTRILDKVPKSRQTLLFSATVPPDIQHIIQSYLRDPETLLLSGDVFTVEGIENVLYYTVDAYPKPRNLLYLVEIEEPENAIVFCNTRDDTALVAAVLNRNGYDADLLNGDLPQKERERVMGKVKAGDVRFMVATDIAARGIDISDLSHVINYSLPEDPAVYLHRVGRTGRIGKKGTAISLVSGKELVTLTALEKRYGITFEERKLPQPEAARKLWTDRHVALLREGAAGSVFEAYLPLAQELKGRPDGEYLLAFALKYFFHHRQKEIARQRLHEPAGATPGPEMPATAEMGSPPRRAAGRRGDRGERSSSKRAEPRHEESAGKRLYLTWGTGDLPEPAGLAAVLAGPSAISADRLSRALRIEGRSAFLELPEADADRLLALHGSSPEGKALRVELARSGPPKTRRRRQR